MIRCKSYTRAATSRRGVSLIEVLMSIFILSVGLMGMASLIPVGGYQVGEAIKSDRAAAVGRAAVGSTWTHLGQSMKARGRSWSFVFEKLEDLL